MTGWLKIGMYTHMCLHAHAPAGINTECSLPNYKHTFPLGVGECMCLQLVVFQVNREKEFSEEQMGWSEE